MIAEPEWFKRASAYEKAWGLAWLADDRRQYINLMREFFDDSLAEYEAFLAAITGKSVLEVGCGPAPQVLSWPASHITLVEPLWYAYAPHLPPLAPHVTALSDRGEDVLLPMLGTIDGAIVCRNTCDHTDTPKDLLTRTLQAGASGCFLLYWGAWKHLSPDEGHRSMTESEEELRTMIADEGYDVIREVHCCPAEHTRDWGCLGRKR